MPKYTADEFMSRLASGAPADAGPLAIHGLAQANEADAATLLFSTGPNCRNWIPIPLSIIESVDHLRDVACADHRHALVKLTLRTPDAADAVALAYLRLFAQAQATAARFGAALTTMARTAAANATPGQRMRRGPPQTQGVEDGCEYLEFDGEVYVCCCTDGQCSCTGVA